jgi:hypothetical protein
MAENEGYGGTGAGIGAGLGGLLGIAAGRKNPAKMLQTMGIQAKGDPQFLKFLGGISGIGAGAGIGAGVGGAVGGAESESPLAGSSGGFGGGYVGGGLGAGVGLGATLPQLNTALQLGANPKNALLRMLLATGGGGILGGIGGGYLGEKAGNALAGG